MGRARGRVEGRKEGGESRSGREGRVPGREQRNQNDTGGELTIHSCFSDSWMATG